MKKSFLGIFLVLLFLSSATALFSQSVEESSIIEMFNKKYYKYELKGYETIESICKAFDIKKKELYKSNPFLRKALRKGQTIIVPVKKAKKKPEKEKQNVFEKIFTGPENNNTGLFYKKRKRICIILPFSCSKSYGAKYVEFYEGFLLAADSLKNKGYSFDIQSIDTGNAPDSTIYNIINSGKLDKADYFIIGPSLVQEKAMSEWTHRNGKKLITFDSGFPETLMHENVYQTTVSNYTMMNEMAKYISEKYADYNIIFSEPENQNIKSSSAFASIIKKHLDKNLIPYSTLQETEPVKKDGEEKDEYKDSFSLTKNNLVIPYRRSLTESLKIIARLNYMTRENPGIKIKIIGYPEWQAFNEKSQNVLYDANVSIYSGFYSRIDSDNVKNLRLKYNITYGKDFLKTYPKYALLGYDTGTCFITKMLYNKYFPSSINIAPVQNRFIFTTDKKTGAYVNKNFYLINYEDGHKISVQEMLYNYE